MRTKSSDRRAELLSELGGLGGIVRSALVRTRRKCGRPGCACGMGERHRFCYLSRSSCGSKNKIVYVKPSEEAAFESGVAAYRRMWAIVEELSAINIDIIKRRNEKGALLKSGFFV